MLGFSPISSAPISALAAAGTEYEGSAAVSAAASTTTTVERRRKSDGSLTGTGSLASVVYRVRESSGNPAGVATSTSSFERIREHSPQVSGIASLSSTIERVRELAPSISALATNTISAKFTARGFGSTTAAGELAQPTIVRVRLGESAVSTSSSLAAAFERVREFAPNILGEAATSCYGRFTARGYGNTTGELSVSPRIVRVRLIDASSTQGVSGVLAVAREKWELIASDPNAWTDITNDSNSWTEIANNPNAWTDITNDATIWADIANDTNTWNTVN